jgi:hypothetical protein
LTHRKAVVGSEAGRSIGENKRTGEYLGGGALLGAIIGGIAGGGRGAAIGAGAAAAAGAQVLTRGERIVVPEESLLTFQLTQPMRAGIVEQGYMRDGVHYHPGYGHFAYEQGIHDGRADAERNLPANATGRQFARREDRRDYRAGYMDGYQDRVASESGRQKPGYNGYNGYNGPWTISVGPDSNVGWQATPNARVYVQVDNLPPKLFANSQSGKAGHLYTFILQDADGNEIARTTRDLLRTPSVIGYTDG